MQSIYESIERIREGTAFYISLGDFLDEFYRSDMKTRQKLIEKEPVSYAEVKKEYYSLMAATAHKLSNDNNLEVPKWVMNKKYIMYQNPYFDCAGKGNLRLLYMYKSPTEFKHRNLFVDENFLVRV